MEAQINERIDQGPGRGQLVDVSARMTTTVVDC